MVDERGHVPVEPFADDVGDRAHAIDVAAGIEDGGVLLGDATARFDLIENGMQLPGDQPGVHAVIIPKVVITV